MINDALRFLINIVFGLFVYSALLRFIMQWLRAPFRNPVGQAVSALTDWAVKPLRKILHGYRGYDWASLVLAWAMQTLWLGGLAGLGGAWFSRTPGGVMPPLPISSLVEGRLGILFVPRSIQSYPSCGAPGSALAAGRNTHEF